MWANFKRWSLFGDHNILGDSECLIPEEENDRGGKRGRQRSGETMTSCTLSPDEGFFSNSSSNADLKDQDLQPRMRGRATTLGVPREQRFSLRLEKNGGKPPLKQTSALGIKSKPGHTSANGTLGVNQGSSSGEVPRRTQSFVAKGVGSKLMKPGFMRQQQQPSSRAGSAQSTERDTRSGSIASVTSHGSSTSEEVGQLEKEAQKNLKGKDFRIKKSQQTSSSSVPVVQPHSSPRSKSVGREARSSGKAARREALMTSKVGVSEGVNHVNKPVVRDHPVMKPPTTKRSSAGGSGQGRFPSRPSSSATSPAVSRSSSRPPSSGIPPPKPQQSSLARIASRLASLVNLGGSPRSGSSPSDVKETAPKGTSASNRPVPLQPTITDIEMSPLTGRRRMVSPGGSKIPRPTSSLTSSRRSSAASSPEPDRVRSLSPSGPTAEISLSQRHSPTISPTEAGRLRSGSGSVSTLVERSLKAIHGPPVTPTTSHKTRLPSDLSPVVRRQRSRADSNVSESEKGEDLPVFDSEGDELILVNGEEYRRIQHEVKLMKTLLLKLKRELQEDSSDSLTSVVPMASTVAETSGEDWSKKLESSRMERDHLFANLEQSKQELECKNAIIMKLNSDLNQALEKNDALMKEVNAFHLYREEMIDKVERLHAEKHKLEDALAQSIAVSEYYSDSELLTSIDGSIELSNSCRLEHKQSVSEKDAVTPKQCENSDPESDRVLTNPQS